MYGVRFAERNRDRTVGGFRCNNHRLNGPIFVPKPVIGVSRCGAVDVRTVGSAVEARKLGRAVCSGLFAPPDGPCVVVQDHAEAVKRTVGKRRIAAKLHRER